MTRDAKEKARQLSEFVDGLVLYRRATEDDRAWTWNDGESRELRGLIAELHEIRFANPDAFADKLLTELPRMAAGAPERLNLWRRLQHSTRRVLETLGNGKCPRLLGAVPSAVLTVTVALVVVLSRSWGNAGLSASEILSRSDAAMVRLAPRDQLLHRRWNVRSVTTAADGSSQAAVRSIDEWLDGRNFDRVAARFYADDGQLRMSYATVLDEGRLRPYVYFSPGLFGETRGLLSIEPTVDEFRDAVRRFPARLGRSLNVYLDRQHIYEPIIGEIRSNRSVVDTPTSGVSDLPRLVISLAATTTIDGVAAYAVRVVDPASIEFAWRIDGPPTVWLVRREAVRYIARDTYLSIKTEETLLFEDGRTRNITRRLIDMRSVPIADAPADLFAINVPPVTAIRRQSADEQLAGVAAAFGRLPDSIISRPASTR